MLPTLNLDDEQYLEISKRAKKLISTMYPEWTDYNEHDPGITFIELFAWLQEMQQFHLNQISHDSYKKYLKLLGIHRNGNVAATAYLHVPMPEDDIHLKKGCIAYAGEIPFETVSEEFITRASITALCSCCYDREGKPEYQRMEMKHGKFQYFPFGNRPKEGDYFEIYLDRPISRGKILNLYLSMYEKYPVKRNPIDSNGFFPLADIEYSYYDGQEWTAVEVKQDDTWQFITSGHVKIEIPEQEKVKGEQSGRENLNVSENIRIRMTLMRAEYDTPPIMEEVHLNMIEVRQQRTLVEKYDTQVRLQDGRSLVDDPLTRVDEDMRVVYINTGENCYRQIETRLFSTGDCYDCLELLGVEGMKIEGVRIIHYKTAPQRITDMMEGDGFPNQTYELFEKGMISKEFELFIEDEIQKGIFHRWDQVEDFSCSQPEDRHYILDEEKSIVCFGDCIHARAPEGKIHIVSCAVTKGMDGNVMAGRIEKLSDGEKVLAVVNYEDACHGNNVELLMQCFERYKKDMNLQKRAVSYADYENNVIHVPGLMIKKVKAIPVNKMMKEDGSVQDNCIYLVVEPYYTMEQKNLSNAYLENIKRALEQVRMIGTKYQILTAEHIGVTIYAEVIAGVNYANPRRYIEQAIRKFFQQNQADFGTPVLYSNIYGIIDTLECVTDINSLSIEAQGRGVFRSSNGDMILPPNGIVFIQDISLAISIG